MNQPGGFTIIETLIVLSIASFLLISSILVFTGNRGSRDFRLAIQDIETKLQDIINDTSTGYFDALGGYHCVKGNPPSFAAGGLGQGTNLDCVFVGKAVLLRPTTSLDTIEISPVVGNRQTLTIPAREVQNLSESKPNTVYPTPDLTASYALKNGIKVKSADTDLVGFYGSFASYSQASTPESSSQKTQMVKHSPTCNSRTCVNTCIKQIGSANSCYDANPATPWTICFQSANAAQTAKISIGGNGSIALKTEFTSC